MRMKVAIVTTVSLAGGSAGGRGTSCVCRGVRCEQTGNAEGHHEEVGHDQSAFLVPH